MLADFTRYLGQHNWTRGFVERVFQSDQELIDLGMPLEGVVGKAGAGPDRVMAKAKRKVWIDALLERCGEDVGRKIAES